MRLPIFAAFGLMLGVSASAQTEPNPFDRFDSPTVGPWEKYGGRPSGVELKPAIIPIQFRGEWNNPTKACGTGISDMRLRIDAKNIRFYESSGEVRRIIRHNSRAITVLGSYSSEGSVWDRVDRLVLSESGKELTVQTGQDKATRYKCPVRRTRK